jgi:tRNA nucleotidyltransferase (CCA-adding enzyme)
MNLSDNEVEEIAERLVFPALLTKAAFGASSLLSSLPSFKEWKPSEWTFHLDELPTLAVYAVWLTTSEQPLREYLEKWQYVKPVTSGDDLKKYGLVPGPKYKEILSRLRAAWLDGEVNTKDEEVKLRDHLAAT